MNTQWLQENWIAVGGAGLMILALVFGGGIENLKANRAIGEEIAAERQTTRALEAESRAATERAERQKRIANERYEMGGVFVVGQNSPGYLSALSDGVQVTDWKTGLPLPNGTIVLDDRGCTGILAAVEARNGVITDTACNADIEVVQAALDQAQPSAQSHKINTGNGGQP